MHSKSEIFKKLSESLTKEIGFKDKKLLEELKHILDIHIPRIEEETKELKLHQKELAKLKLEKSKKKPKPSLKKEIKPKKEDVPNPPKLKKDKVVVASKPPKVKKVIKQESKKDISKINEKELTREAFDFFINKNDDKIVVKEQSTTIASPEPTQVVPKKVKQVAKKKETKTKLPTKTHNVKRADLLLRNNKLSSEWGKLFQMSEQDLEKFSIAVSKIMSKHEEVLKRIAEKHKRTEDYNETVKMLIEKHYENSDVVGEIDFQIPFSRKSDLEVDFATRGTIEEAVSKAVVKFTVLNHNDQYHFDYIDISRVGIKYLVYFRGRRK